MLSASEDRTPLVRAVYHAPRGRTRMYQLAARIGQLFLRPDDYLIGIIGSEGSGKSTLIKGLFPGLELTNDDEGINKPTSAAFDFDPDAQFCGHTFHIDMRYEMAFHQMHEIVDTVKAIVNNKRRVIVEHFDLLYRHLGFNAQILFGLGEDLRVYRATVFGPSPFSVRKMAFESLKYRLMAHSAEDIMGRILRDKYHYQPQYLHSEVHHGFVVGFDEEPDWDLNQLEREVLEVIDSDISITPGEGDHVLFDGEPFICTGKRCHVKRSSQIENFRLLKHFKYDPMIGRYLLVGIVGDDPIAVEKHEGLPPMLGGEHDGHYSDLDHAGEHYTRF
ncbi:MAG: alanine-tRNA synthetase second additional domain-containing protein [bacterium]|nr:alanine-tRNA synthetase second additional domain-containing protein [bacterium]